MLTLGLYILEVIIDIQNPCLKWYSHIELFPEEKKHLKSNNGWYVK